MADSHTEIILTFLQTRIAQLGATKPHKNTRGPGFESTIFIKLCDFLGCTRIRKTANHPAANGMVELLHRQLKAAPIQHADHEHWVDNLPIFPVGIRSAFKPDVNARVAKLLNESTLPGQAAKVHRHKRVFWHIRCPQSPFPPRPHLPGRSPFHARMAPLLP